MTNKTQAFRGMMLGIALIGMLATTPQVSADSFVSVRIGMEGPPPPRQDIRWERPYRTAVWIPGHYEWRHKHYVWIAGYYEYPPRRNSHWVEPRYIRHRDGSYYYRPGHWVD